MSKPIVINQIELKAPIDSPILTGTPQSVTPASGDNSTKIATTEFVTSGIDNNTKFVKKAGDTMTGNLLIKRTSGGGGVQAYRTNDTTNNDSVFFGYNSGDLRGLYDSILGQYWCYLNSAGNIILRMPSDNDRVSGEKKVLISKTTSIENNYPAKLMFEVIQTDNSISGQGAYIAAYDDHDAYNYGLNLVIQGASNCIIGAGESANACYQNVCKDSSSEQMYITSDNNIYFYPNCQTWANHKTTVYISTTGVLYGACWNDYAETRDSKCAEPGRCVIEVGDDTLIKSSKRMQPGANIVSDTFGFSIGAEDKVPLAVSGRVLAYGYESREEFRKNIGRPVCSGPNGTVSIMTDEEYRGKGYCAIGTISAVPDYVVWGETKIKVDGRVWIKVI